MSELVSMSFDGAAAPGLTVRASRSTGVSEYGWGFGWYPNEELTGVVIKDPSSSGNEGMAGQLREWDTFNSTIFLCHLRGATKKARQRDAQPFMRSYAGRHWVFAHNGDLQPDFGSQLDLGIHPVFEPVGRTDSEHVFCWLLTALRSEGARSLVDFGWENLHRACERINELGTANLMISDGQSVVTYNDRNNFHPLHRVRRVPPHGHDRLEAAELVVELDGVHERNRTMVIASTLILSDEAWQPMEAGEMAVARRGSIVWDSRPEHAAELARYGRAQTVVPPGAAAQHQAEQLPGSAAQGAAAGQAAGQAAGAVAAPVLVERPGVGELASRVLSVVHRTSYEYEEAVEHSSHLLRLVPTHDAFQEVAQFALDVSVVGTRADYEDVFGNAVTYVEVTSPFNALEVCGRSLVRVFDPPSITRDAPSRREHLPLVWMPWQRQMMSPYLLPPELHESELTAISDYAMGFVARNDHDLIETFLDINETLYRDFSYESGSTTLETTPYEVFVSRRGVCQDFANLFICMARLLNVPARYRVGYIYTGASYENKIQSEASHAWVEVYLPWSGWRGFDPTNGCLTGLDHVRVACGRNFRDATPTAGTIYKGGGGEKLSVAVEVEHAAEPSPASAS